MTIPVIVTSDTPILTFHEAAEELGITVAQVTTRAYKEQWNGFTNLDIAYPFPISNMPCHKNTGYAFVVVNEKFEFQKWLIKRKGRKNA